MNTFLFVVIIVSLSVTNGQRCQGKFNGAIVGNCSFADSCRGTVLAVQSCEIKGCCVVGTSPSSSATCIRANDFDILYNTTRATFLREVLDYGVNAAGICSNCQAKAAFLAIAATMTDNFQNDETAGTEARFATDDAKYGNNRPGDGSRYRRRGFFGLRGRRMYARLQTSIPKYQSLNNPESVALQRNSIEIAVQLWNKPDLLNGMLKAWSRTSDLARVSYRNRDDGIAYRFLLWEVESDSVNQMHQPGYLRPALTQYADGSFYSFSMLWYKLTGDIDKLSDAAKQYSKFLRQLKCGGDLYPGQGPVCRYNATHNGKCSPDCIRGLEESGEYCGCSGGKGRTCPNSPAHIRCCLDTCSQELKMDLGFVLDASGSVGASNYALQLKFTKDLLDRVNVGENKTHVGIINYSTRSQILTWLNTDYDLRKKIQQVDRATYFGLNTDTALALTQANNVFSYQNGLREVEEGATPVLFVITDGESNDPKATIAAAAVLKNKGIQIVSVGVGKGPNLNELHAICTPPVSDNYFAMSDYAALEQKLNQFTSKSCSEPAPVPLNTTVTGECGKDKYKFLKIKITWIGNKIMISVKLFNGKVKLFFSFTSRNPKDPTDFENYEQITTTSYTQSTPTYGTTARNLKAANDEVTLIIDKPDTDEEFVYVGVKGVEDDNKFEVKFDDCEHVNCNSSPGLPVMKLSMVLMAVCVALFFPMK